MGTVTIALLSRVDALVLIKYYIIILETEASSELKKPYCKNRGPMMPLAFISEVSCLRKCSDWCCAQKTCRGQREGMCIGRCERQSVWQPNQEMAKEKGLKRKGPYHWWSCCCKKCSGPFGTPIG